MAIRRAFIIDGDKVRARRELLGLSQSELARRCGLTQPMLSYIESGARNPAPKVMVTIASVLGAQAEDIVRPAETEPAS